MSTDDWSVFEYVDYVTGLPEVRAAAQVVADSGPVELLTAALREGGHG